MAQTTSFVVRFTQNIFKNEQDKSDIQWRGSISHVQGEEKINFVEFQDALEFMQGILENSTRESIIDQPEEEQEDLLTKSIELWKKMALTGPKMVLEVIKDPKKQMAQIQDQISQVGDEISQRVEIDAWRGASKADFNKLFDSLNQLNNRLDDLENKVDSLSPVKKK